MEDKIKIDGTNYNIIDSSKLDTMQGNKTSTLKKIDGRTYELIKITKDVSYPRILLGVGAAVATLFLLIGGQIKTIKNMWDVVFSGKTVKHVATDLTKEGRIHKVATKMGLIPTLTDDSQKPYIWSKDQVVRTDDEFITLTDKIQQMASNETLTTEIQQRQEEIGSKKETFRKKMSEDTSTNGPRSQVEEIARQGKLKSLGSGQGGAYLLTDQDNVPKFVVKPNDEDILCLNNRKGLANPLFTPGLRVRGDIPTYESVQNEALGSDIAGLAGLRQIAPTTTMVILTNEGFHQITDSLPKEYAEELIGANDKEKLCSAQEFVANSKDLQEYTTEKSEKNEKVVFNQEDFEMANIFSWITADQDGHSGNYRVFEENGEMRLKKIDNGLICGEENQRTNGIVNGLSVFTEQMERPLSANGRKKIEEIPLAEIQTRMRFYNKSEAAVESLTNRVKMLQEFIENSKSIDLATINKTIVENYGRKIER